MRGGRRGPEDTRAGSSLLLLGEFQSVAEDLDSLLLMTGSTCRGKLTVEAEHLPAPERRQHTPVTTEDCAAPGRVPEEGKGGAFSATGENPARRLRGQRSRAGDRTDPARGVAGVTAWLAKAFDGTYFPCGRSG